MSDKKKIPQSRLERLAKLGGLAARVASEAATAVAAGVAIGRDAAMAKLHEETAQKLLAALGDMKGLPMKLGQILSFMDGVIPAEAQPIYRKALAKLQVNAQPVAWSVMEGEITRALGGPIAKFFAQFSQEPIAAASIGQVYAATLPDGRRVAVKVQYPGIRTAMESDLKNINGVIKTLAAVIPKLDVGKFASDFLARISEECDYVREAAHQEQFRQIWAGDAAIVIPGVIPELTRRNVLVTELMTGQSFRELADSGDQAEKNLAAATMFRFAFHSIELHGLFNADPHPGNYLFLGGGRVVFLDFGCVQAYDEVTRRAFVELRDAARSGLRGDDLWTVIRRVLVFEKDSSAEVRQTLVDYALLSMRAVIAPQPFKFTTEYTTELADMTVRLKLAVAKSLLKEGWSEPRRDGVVHLGRIVFGLFSLLADLRAESDWTAMLPAQ
jgi:predicted unusual protein kinase regulating ubiquinone biosynthesis (AarF/ABC1/UbiB family)